MEERSRVPRHGSVTLSSTELAVSQPSLSDPVSPPSVLFSPSPALPPSLPQVVSLQEQLGKGPSAQLTRLQQENSILRDALEKSTSQAESV